MKTGTKVAIAVGGATVAGVVLYLILKPSASAPPASTQAPAPTPQIPNSPQNQTVNMPTPAAPAAPQATYLLEPTGPTSAGMKVGETIEIQPVKPDPRLVWGLFLKPTASGGPIVINPSLQDAGPTVGGQQLTSGTYKAVAVGPAIIHVTPGIMQDHGAGPDWTMTGAPGFDVTIVVS